ncbi:MAG: hypothetical protein KA419_02965 [Acidobacteria bacterium]|nr:hypothetical protein [Acidobacteriota bacterium]
MKRFSFRASGVVLATLLSLGPLIPSAFAEGPPPGYVLQAGKDVEIAPGWTVRLDFFVEDVREEGAVREKPAIVELRSHHEGKNYVFRCSDPDPGWPVYEFSTELAGQTHPTLLRLDGLVVHDLDRDGTREILLYGLSSHGGSGMLGRCMVIGLDKDTGFKARTSFSGTDNFQFWYDTQNATFLIAQFVWRMGREAHYGDAHAYVIEAFDPALDPAPWKLDFTKKKYGDEDGVPIDTLIDGLRAKLAQVRAGRLPPAKAEELTRFVTGYWAAVTARNLKALRDACADELFFYSKVLPVGAVMAEKRRLLAKSPTLKFTCTNFLVYRRGDRVVAEYDKEYGAEKEGHGGKVRSVLELVEKDGVYRVVTEKDLGIYFLDGDLASPK